MDVRTAQRTGFVTHIGFAAFEVCSGTFSEPKALTRHNWLDGQGPHRVYDK